MLTDTLRALRAKLPGFYLGIYAGRTPVFMRVAEDDRPMRLLRDIEVFNDRRQIHHP
jgi:hypothetical protein